MKFKKNLIHANLAIILTGIGTGTVWADYSPCTPSGTTLTCSNAKDTPSDLAGYDNVIIDTGTNEMSYLPSGFGIYANGSTWNLKNLKIETNTGQSDAIRTNGGAKINITGKLVINTYGSSADGINASESSAATVNIGNDAEISTVSGIGVRSNLSTGTGTNLIQIGDGLTVTTQGNGSNLIDGVGYGVYAGTRSYKANTMNGNAKVIIGNNSKITTGGSSAHAVYANRGGVVQLGSTTVQTGNKNAYGIYAETGATASGNRGGIVDLLGNTNVTVPTGGTAIYASGADSVIASFNSDTNSKTAGIFTVTGDIKGNNGGKVDLHMNDGSTIRGNTSVVGANSIVNLDMTGQNSLWMMSANSNLTNLNVTNGANVYLGNQTDPITAANQITLTIDDLTGDNGIFNLRTDIVGSGAGTTNISDMIKVTKTSSGNHKIMVNDHSTGGAVGDEIVRVAEIANDGSTRALFTLNNVNGYVDLGAYKYELVEKDSGTIPDQKDWYLQAKASGPGPVGPTGPGLNNTADHSVNILNINYLLNYVENQTLLQRMGEIRQSGNMSGNVWARGYTGQLDSFGNHQLEDFDLDYNGVQIGADKHIELNNNDLYIGGMIGTAKAKADYKVGDGDTESYHAGIYATYKTQNNFYIDGIAKYVHMKNSFNTETGGGYAVKGDGKTDGFTFSVETGKRFYLEQPKSGWYVEPQAQLAYSHQDGTTIKSSNGLKTKLDSFDSVLGRVSAIVGYSLNEDTNPVDIYLKTGYIKEFAGKTGYTFNNDKHWDYKFNGNWWDNGIGVNAQINKNHNVYFEADYAKGNKFDRKQLNLGYRYSF